MLPDPPRGHHDAGSAGPALGGAASLERLEGARVEGLHGRHALPTHLVGGDEAGVHRQAVQINGAGAALALATALFGSREPELIAQGVEEAGGGVYVDRHW